MDDSRHSPPETQARTTGMPGLREVLRGLRSVWKLLLQRRTWQHIAYALFLPLGLALIVGTMRLMKWERAGDGGGIGPLVLLVAIAVVALCGPPFERGRARMLLGEEIGRGPREGRIKRGTAFFFANLALGSASFAVVIGWVIVSLRNLSYPFWGWVPYPDPAWGGPTPLGAVSLHFAAGVVTFFGAPWLVIRLTRWQVQVARRLIGSG
ncbi:sensor domain-containing protein [Streptomyces ochraceiscleroticus]|uniref:Sensor domain-containing protein n=1 Tax=Streptomyces ochraceiscleroticus TaxID=47761 RepID=A0ABW1MPT5_9ACTN|nr:sensor domain-containing protein [Streptomyces ochraceiscleroticus]